MSDGKRKKQNPEIYIYNDGKKIQNHTCEFTFLVSVLVLRMLEKKGWGTEEEKKKLECCVVATTINRVRRDSGSLISGLSLLFILNKDSFILKN